MGRFQNVVGCGTTKGKGKTLKRPLRIYLDTSVFGGCFAPKFELPSRRLFSYVRKGKYTIVISDVVSEELANAPSNVREFAESMEKFSERVDVTSAAVALQAEYIKAGIVTKRSLNDALHVAIATTSAVDAIVSWNFKDIVKLVRITGYNKVNMLHGYQKLTIISPQEVIHEESAE